MPLRWPRVYGGARAPPLPARPAPPAALARGPRAGRGDEVHAEPAASSSGLSAPRAPRQLAGRGEEVRAEPARARLRTQRSESAAAAGRAGATRFAANRLAHDSGLSAPRAPPQGRRGAWRAGPRCSGLSVSRAPRRPTGGARRFAASRSARGSGLSVSGGAAAHSADGADRHAHPAVGLPFGGDGGRQRHTPAAFADRSPPRGRARR